MSTVTSADPPLHRLDVDTYDRIVESGALDGHRVELLDGVLVEVSPQSPAHALIIEQLQRHLGSDPRLRVRVQSPLRVPPGSEPEPDLALLAERPPAGVHPSTALLVVEVSISTHTIDRNVKTAHYARARVPTYWLVDVPGRAVEARTQPGRDGYERCDIYQEGSVVPSPLDGVDALDVTALLADVRG
jgi:Uma2 family endonuclease